VDGSGPLSTKTQVATTVGESGRAVSEHIVNTLTSPKDPHLTAVMSQVFVTYSAFGTSPPVTAPPASDISG
jgi:hypothetical protein